MALLTGSQILMECLLEQETDTVFGYPGGAVLFIYDELYKYSDKIRHILTSHEQGAAHAADGYARSTGKPGVCIATSGPGATNLVTGIATAYMDSSPVVFITGNVASDLIGKDSFQEADITGITMPVTKYNCIVKDVKDLADTIRKAFAIAKAGRPGPVLIDIPKDVSNSKAHYKRAGKEELTRYGELGVKRHPLRKEDAETFGRMLASAKKPVIIAGGGVARSGAFEKVKEFAELTKAPVAVTLMGMGSFPSSHSQHTGMLGMHGTKAANIAVSEADLIISLGCRFSDRVIGDAKKFASKGKLIHIDIDGAEIDKNIISYLGITGDIDEVLSFLLRQDFVKEIDTCSKEWQDKIFRLKKFGSVAQISEKFSYKGIFDGIFKQTDGDCFIVTDVGQHQMWAATNFLYNFPNRLITSGGFGTMGFGAGAAIGTQIGNPDGTVVHIAGDGSFRMNCNELATEEYYRLPIITVIMNNGTLGMVRQWQTLFYEGRYSSTTLDRGPDFVKLAEAYCIKGYSVNTLEEFIKVFAEAVKSRRSTVIDCHIERDEQVRPMVASGKPITEFILE